MINSRKYNIKSATRKERIADFYKKYTLFLILNNSPVIFS